MNRFTVALSIAALALVIAVKAESASATTFDLHFTENCYGWGADVKLRWDGLDPRAQQWVDVSRYDNGWLAGTFGTSGALAGSTETYTWTHLTPDVPYLVRISQLSDGRWSFSQNFVIRPCASIDAQRAGLMNSNSPNKPNTSCGPACSNGLNWPPTYP